MYKFKQTLKSEQEVRDFVRGLTFYGTGGGGDFDTGVEALMSQLEKGIEIGWVDPNDIADDVYTICPFLMGSIAPMTDQTREEMKIYGLDAETRKYDWKDMLALAVKRLEKEKGKKVSALVPIELGGGNAGACIAASAMNGIVTLDGDYTGRAIPEIQQTTPNIFEKELLPITTCDAWGNTAVIENAVSWRMAERMGKFISAAAYSAAGEAGFWMTGKDTKEVIIAGTMTECYEVGKFIREAREAGKDPVLEITAKLGGWLLNRGTVTKKEWWDKDGYYWGYHTVTGEKDFQDNELKVWFKNENHVSWKNGDVFITSPDMIIFVDDTTCEPFTNNKIEEGQKVAVIGLKARDVFRLPRGIEVLGPKAFGFDIDYLPIEEFMAR